MVFATALFFQLLLAAATFAIPSHSDRLAARLERRAPGAHQGRPRLTTDGLVKGNTTHEDYSSNWAGAVLVANSATYTAVTATFVVPSPKAPSGGKSSTSFAASAWVGIDGDTCDSAILQTGVDFTSTNGKVSFDAWYEWYPDYAYDFSGIPISVGDTITITVTASSTKAGSAVIKNVSTGKTVTKSITSSSALCQTNAEWIVEDFEEGSSLVPFANFGTVTFTNAQATTKSGTVGPSGSDLIDIKQGSTVLTSSSVSSNSVTVKYV